MHCMSVTRTPSASAAAKAAVWCAVFGRITNKVSRVEGLQIGQLVKFHKDCIADVADDDDSDSD